ncbi:MAG: universal stress protein [Candidatus Binataceae bacterium]
MLYPFRSIVSPLQFDEHSIAALELAKDVAARNEATIYLLHVVPTLPAIGEKAISSHVGVEEDKARKMLEEIARKHLQGVKHEVVIRGAFLSEVAQAVLEVAKEVKADLIVMATHGRTGLPHFFMGSVTEGVMRGAPCPVLTVKPEYLKQKLAGSQSAAS